MSYEAWGEPDDGPELPDGWLNEDDAQELRDQVAQLTNALSAVSFQSRVAPWMMECFGAEIAADRVERNHRFFEEATELVQALGMTASEAYQLVDYTFSRRVGDPSQEVGGSMVTLAALCLANGIDMHLCGERELDRINNPFTLEKIRAKQAAKPKHSPLPEHIAPKPELTADDELIWQQWLVFKESACLPTGDRFFESFRKAGLALLGARLTNVQTDRLAALETAMEGVSQEMLDGGWNARSLSKYARSLEDKIAEIYTAPTDWKLVPIEPTKEMWDAVNKLDDQMSAGGYDGKGCSIEQAWNCMLDAAPTRGPDARSVASDVGWTGNTEIDAALVMLDRLDVQSDDDTRVDAISATLRRIATRDAVPSANEQRYLWLREQHWNESKLAVVCDPKESIKLGYDCPSGQRLDEIIDAARASAPKGV